MLPLRDIVIFPHMVVPLFIGRERSIHALEYAMGLEKHILLCTQKDPRKDEPRETEVFKLGTLASILQLLRLPDGTVKVLVEGKGRAVIRQFLQSTQFFQVEAEELNEFWEITPETEALHRTAVAGFESYAKLNKKVPQEALQSLAGLDDPGRLADLIAGTSPSRPTRNRGSWKTWTPTTAWRPSSPWLTAKTKSSISKAASRIGSRNRWKRPSGNTTSMSRCGPSRRRWVKRRTWRGKSGSWKGASAARR